jgi:hypothetical protein
MSPHEPDPHVPSLTLLKVSDPLPARGLVPLPPLDGAWEERSHVRTLAHRPGDHLELWSFEAVGALRSLRREARDRGIHPDTAVSIVCERRLACAELEAVDLLAGLAAIEEAAANVHAPVTMWGANRAYLRHLRHGDPLERESRVPIGGPQAAVPIRLLERLGEGEVLAAPLEKAELAEALCWEIASLCTGKLISEWANGVALAVLAGTSASLAQVN